MYNSHKFFRNTGCRYFPCHEHCDPERFNCLFCYCPLYGWGEECGGDFTYSGDTKKIKNCENCVFPHEPESHDRINAMIKDRVS